MKDLLKEVAKQPYHVIALILGTALVAFPYIRIDKDHWTSQPPITLVPVVVGITLLLLSSVSFALTLLLRRSATDVGAGVDLTRVKESKDVLWTTVGDCEIRIVEGRIEDQPSGIGTVIALPCNEYFDDRCVGDPKSSLGAYVSRIFEGQADEFVSLMKEECGKKLGSGVEQQKTNDERVKSLGVGRCVLLVKPLGKSVSVALVSTTTQRAGQGLSARISYQFDGMRELFSCLADARLNEVVMPILGSGHGGLGRSLAFVGLLLAVAEAALYGQGSQRPKKVTIVLFKRDANSPAEVDKVVVRRALALIGT